MKRFTALITFLLLGFAATSHAQFEPKSYSFSPTIGLYTFDQHQELKSSALVGLRISRYLTSRFAMEGVLLYVPTESKTKIGSDNEVSGTLYHLDGLYHFPNKTKWLPFLAAGVGAMTLSGSNTGADNNLMLNYGGGLKYLYSDKVSLRADVRQVLLDDVSIEHNMVYTLGLEFSWGRGGKNTNAKSDNVPIASAASPFAQEESAPASAGAAAMGDSDKDGVPDAHDLCANTPLGLVVDKEGCPIDSDGDGTADHLDKCPDTPKGLITDKNGCTLDTDQDGVSDSRDFCADTPRGIAVDKKGCPLKSAGSEADSDGDGVSDALDKCPGTPIGTPVDKNGCPMEIKEKTTTESHIRFETGKAKIRAGFMGEVERVANYLKKFPETSIEIEGHTDTTGPEKLNVRLSLERAESLKKALVSHFGIKASRLSTIGHSFKRPIADNNTVEGREKNRRVVVTLSPEGK